MPIFVKVSDPVVLTPLKTVVVHLAVQGLQAGIQIASPMGETAAAAASLDKEGS